MFYTCKNITSHFQNIIDLLFLTILLLLISCNSKTKLEPVTYADFALFVGETGYITDAEKFGWSFIQQDVLNFEVDSNLTWRTPSGFEVSDENFPVTQVSYNDAIAYCTWTGARLPSYDEYWKLVDEDKRAINQTTSSIQAIPNVNIVGNVWEITNSIRGDEIRLAGGSYLCDINTCNGTNPKRKLYVDKFTGNTHISFAVIKE